MDGSASYNANSLQTYSAATRTGINLNVIEHTDIPDQDAALYAIANADDSDVPDDNYPSRTIKLGGTIHGSTQSDLDSRIDAFKAIFRPRKKNLDIGYAGSTRRYVMLKVNAQGISRSNKNLYATFTLELICKPFGCDTSTTDLWTAKTAFTSNTFTEAMTVGGTAPFQLPIITITLTSITGAGDYLMISNDNNGQQLLIYGQGLANGDVLVINCETRKITRNGNEIDFDGTLLELAPGSNSITYTDGFTTRSINISAVYTKRWL